MMIVIVLIAVVAIGIAVFVMRKPSKDNPTIENDISISTDEGEKFKVELDSQPASTIHFSDDFKSSGPVTTNYDNHEITTILKCKNDPTVWICPCCEVENLHSNHVCIVCHYKK